MTGWWYKAFLFSQEARESIRAAPWYQSLTSSCGSDDVRCLYIDLDSVIVGPLDELAATKLAPTSPLGLLGTDDMVNEVGIRFSGESYRVRLV